MGQSQTSDLGRQSAAAPRSIVNQRDAGTAQIMRTVARNLDAAMVEERRDVKWIVGRLATLQQAESWGGRNRLKQKINALLAGDVSWASRIHVDFVNDIGELLGGRNLFTEGAGEPQRKPQ